MSREWENWFILKEENYIFGVRCIVSKILHPHGVQFSDVGWHYAGLSQIWGNHLL